MLYILVVLKLWLLVQWPFKVTMARDEEGLWLVHKVVTVAASLRTWGCNLGVWHKRALMTVAASCGQLITICDLYHRLPMSKINGKASRRLQVTLVRCACCSHFFLPLLFLQRAQACNSCLLQHSPRYHPCSDCSSSNESQRVEWKKNEITIKYKYKYKL